MVTNYILPAQVREELLRYLGNKPYREVAQGFQALVDLKPLDGDAPPDPSAEETPADG